MALVIISGVSRGLGKALYTLLHHSKNDIVAIGRNFPDAQELPTSKGNVWKSYCDLSSLDAQLPDFSQYPLREANRVVFINNAGVLGPLGPLENSIDEESILRASIVNYISPMRITRNIVRACRELDIACRIVNVSTGAANNPYAGWSIYCSTKAAFKMFLNCVSLEDSSVEVRHFDPGIMDTDMQRAIRDCSDADFPAREYFVRYYEEKRAFQPEAVARELLCSEGLL